MGGSITAASTLIALLLGVPAAYKLAYYPTKRSSFTLGWVMSTRMLPAVGIIVPLYVIFKTLKWFDTYHGLVVLYTAINLPLVIWIASTAAHCGRSSCASCSPCPCRGSFPPSSCA